MPILKYEMPNVKGAERKLVALLLITAVLLTGYALRIYHLDAKDIWVDEAYLWSFARLPVVESVLLGFATGPINSNADPLCNILLHFWIELTGESLFALRFFSVLVNLMGVAYLGRVTVRIFGKKAGRAALAIGALAPLWVFYSQEIRPYALTPTLMLIMVDAVLQIGQGDSRRVRPWLWLVLGEALSLYAHGFMAFGVIGINLWLGLLWLRELHRPGRWIWLRNWIISQIAALALLSPSIPIYLARTGGFTNPFVPPVSGPLFANELWAYFMGIPREQAADFIPMHWLAVAALVLILIALAVSLRRRAARPLADLVWLVLGISGLAFAYALRDPSVHPRYLVFLTGPLFVVLGVLAVDVWEAGARKRWLGALLALAILLISILGITNLHMGRYSGYRHASTRAVTDALKADFGPQDGIIMVDAHDFTLAYYGVGQAPLAWARLDDGVDTPASIVDFIDGKQRIALLRNTNERSDQRKIVPFYLERFGSLVSRQYFEGYDLSTYQLDAGSSPALASLEPAQFSWGMLNIKGKSVASGDAVTVALEWETTDTFASGSRYAASIRLVDPVTEWNIATADALLLADNGYPTDRWQPGKRTTQYFVLPLQPGTPPISAEIIVTLYDTSTGQAVNLRDVNGAPAGQQAVIGSVTLGPAPDRWAYEGQRPWQLTPVEASSILSGYAIDKPVTTPGGSLGVTLGWLVSPESLRDQQVRLQLVQGDQVLAEDNGLALQGRPPANIPPGQSWLDRRHLKVRGDAQSGPVDLMIQIGDRRFLLSSLEIAGFERITQPPSIEHPLEAAFGDAVKLLGYKVDAPDPLTSRSTITLTLYWQALIDGSPNANYKVFTQILGADGRLVGQHDGVPAYENRPFSGWLSGEYVIDEHPMKFNEPYTGPIRIQIGLYDPATGVRVLTAEETDAVSLPIRLDVASE